MEDNNMFKPNISTEALLSSYTVKVAEVTARKVNTDYHNSTDVSEYPSLVKFVIVNDNKNVNDCQTFYIKLKKTDGLTPGDKFDFSKAKIVNGKVHFWARKNYVNVSIKGDTVTRVQ